MADRTAAVNGNHEVEKPSKKTTQPTVDQSYMPKKGYGLTDGTSGHTERQSHFRTTHRRASLVRRCTELFADPNPSSRPRAP